MEGEPPVSPPILHQRTSAVSEIQGNAATGGALSSQLTLRATAPCLRKKVFLSVRCGFLTNVCNASSSWAIRQ